MPPFPTFDLSAIGGHSGYRDLIDAVLLAGRTARIMQEQGVAARTTIKADRSPVTEADVAVEQQLRAYLNGAHPNAHVVGEEEGSSGQHHGALRFIIDPIDGTRAFVRGFDSWSVLLGLEADGVPVLGIAYLPARDMLITAVAGQGAYCNGQPLHVSVVDTLDLATVCHGTLGQFAEGNQSHLLASLGQETHAQQGRSDFPGYLAVALGQAEAMVDPGVKPWDICPAAVIVREAGGRLTDFAGKETIYGGAALASNGILHPHLLDILTKSS